MVFEKDLKRLGLTDKEACVYLACLQLGSAAVQKIARKAQVVRATTYVILGSLEKQGLVTNFKQGKKTLFSAEAPRQLLRLLENEREVINEKQHELEQLLPELQVLMKVGGDRPTVRYFEGIEGLRAIRQEMVMYSKSGDTWYNLTPLDHLEAIFGSGGELIYTKNRMAKGIQAKTLFATKSEKMKKELLKPTKDLAERRYIPTNTFSSSSGFTIYRNRVAIGVFTGKLGGVIIESEAIADTMRSLFNLAWQSADKLD